MEEKKKVSFSHYLEKFPVVELPFTVGSETHHLFSQSNDPLPMQMIGQFILPLEEEEGMDDITEYIACFSLPATKHYVALVYWRAGLLQYQYRLVVYQPKTGEVIDHKVIAGTYFDGTDLTQSAATITEHHTIYIVSGQQQDGMDEYQASSSTASRFQIGEHGKIVEL